MEWYYILTIIILALQLIVASFVAIFGIIQYSKSKAIERSKNVFDLQKSFQEEAIMNVFDIIDLDRKQIWYKESFYDEKEKEFSRNVDKLLLVLNYACYLFINKLITEKEINTLNYKLNRVLTDPNVKCYLWNIYHFSKRCNSVCSFNSLITYAFEKGFIVKTDFESDIETESSDYKKKVINF